MAHDARHEVGVKPRRGRRRSGCRGALCLAGGAGCTRKLQPLQIFVDLPDRPCDRQTRPVGPAHVQRAPAGRTLQDRIPQRNERFGQRREREVRLFHLAGLPQGRILCDRIGFRALQRPCERQHQAPQVDQGGRQPLLCPHGAEQHSGGQQPRFVGVRHGAFVGAGFSGLRPRCRGENQV